MVERLFWVEKAARSSRVTSTMISEDPDSGEPLSVTRDEAQRGDVSKNSGNGTSVDREGNHNRGRINKEDSTNRDINRPSSNRETKQAKAVKPRL